MNALNIPNHIGYIVDGNRRWAKKYGLPSYEGHMAGYNTTKEIVEATFRAGVKYVSLYIFSTENWKRSKDEVKKIMDLMMKLLVGDLEMFVNNNIKLKVIGSRIGIGKKIIEAIDNAEQKTKDNTDGTLAICFNYGGQLEIVDAIRSIMNEGIVADDIDVQTISDHIYCPEIPPIDLVVRTSGEQRLSNFMTWRTVYSEFLFLKKFWPDMKKEDLTDIIKKYSKRSRRLGK